MQVQGQQPPAAAAVPALNFGNFNGLLPPIFHGQRHEDVDAWLFQLDSYKLIKNFGDAQCLVVLGHCLREDALDWWQGVNNNFLTYIAFKAGVKARFGESEAVLMQRLLHIEQGRSETVRHYVDRFRLLVSKTGYPDAGRKNLFVQGLNATFKERVQVNRTRNLADAIEAAIDFEDMDIGSSPEHIRDSGRPRKPETDSDLMRETVQAVKGITADVKGMTQDFKKLALHAQQNHNGYWPADTNNVPECWKCGRQGHRASECKAQPVRQDTGNYYQQQQGQYGGES